MRANWTGVRSSARMRSAYLASNPAGSPLAGAPRTSARASRRPTSKSSSASPRASIARGSARRLRTLTAPGFDRITIASPSQTNQVGTRCGAPSARVDDSQITGSVSRNRRTRAAARSVVVMAAASVARTETTADDRRGPAWTTVDVRLRPYTRPVRLLADATPGDRADVVARRHGPGEPPPLQGRVADRRVGRADLPPRCQPA